MACCPECGGTVGDVLCSECEGVHFEKQMATKDAELLRLRHMLRRCWPAVFDWRYGPMSTVCDTKQLLIDMEEFRGKPGDEP